MENGKYFQLIFSLNKIKHLIRFLLKFIHGVQMNIIWYFVRHLIYTNRYPTNDEPVHWSLYASSSLMGLIHLFLDKIPSIS